MVIKHLRKLFGGKGDFVESGEINSLKSSIRNSFEFLKEDMKKQRLWINHLYALNNKLNQGHDELKNHHKNHDTVHSRDIDNLNKWISHLKDTQKNHDSDIRRLENSIKNAFGTYNKYMMDMYKVVHSLRADVNSITKKHQDYDKTFEEIKSIDRTRPELLSNESAPAISSALNDPMVNQYEPKSLEAQSGESETDMINKISENLTRSEKMLIVQLMDTDQKLSYKDLAVLTNSSTSTIKNHICNIKNKGFPIKEYKDENNSKRYYVEENLKNILLS